MTDSLRPSVPPGSGELWSELLAARYRLQMFDLHVIARAERGIVVHFHFAARHRSLARLTGINEPNEQTTSRTETEQQAANMGESRGECI